MYSHDSAEPNSIPNQQYKNKGQELITQSHPSQCEVVTKQQVPNTIFLPQPFTADSLVQSIVESSVSQPEKQIPINFMAGVATVLYQDAVRPKNGVRPKK